MCVSLLLIGGASAASSGDETNKDAGAITGRITAARGRRVPAMIVYLQPTDPKRRFRPAQAEVAVSQKGATFTPSFIVISVGQRIAFPNDEDRPIEHNVFSRSPAKQFDLGLYKPGVKKSVTFDKPGPVKLFCSIHRYMDGVVFVSPTPFFAHVGKDGRYRIANVPPGEYDLKTWQRRRRYLEQTKRVRVDAGGKLTVDLELKRK